MIEQELRDKLAPVVRTNQIIVGAMVGGLVICTLVMVFVSGGDPAATPVTALVAAGIAGMALIARPFLGLIGTDSDDAARALPESNRTTGDPLVDRVIGNWTTGNVVRGAVLEGPGLLNAIAYLIDGQWWSLAIVGVMVVWMLGGFPSMNQLEQRIEERRAGVTPEPDV